MRADGRLWTGVVGFVLGVAVTLLVMSAMPDSERGGATMSDAPAAADEGRAAPSGDSGDAGGGESRSTDGDSGRRRRAKVEPGSAEAEPSVDRAGATVPTESPAEPKPAAAGGTTSPTGTRTAGAVGGGGAAGGDRARASGAAAGASATLVVDVLGPDGAQLEGVSFSLSSVTSNSMSTGGARAKRDEDGSWSIELAAELAAGGDAGSVHTLVASTRELGEVRTVFDPGTDRRLQVRFGTPATLTIALAGHPEEYPGDGVAVDLVPATAAGLASPMLRRRDAAVKRGTWTSGPLAPGEYRIRIIDQSRPSRGVLAEKRVQLVSGPNDVALPRPGFGDLEIVFDPSHEGAGVGLASTRSFVRAYEPVSRVGADGVARFEGVPAGRHLVVYMVKGERREMPVEIPRDTRVVFEPVAIDGLRVTEVRSGGYLEQVGLRLDDVIVAIDDTRFEESWTARKLFRGLQGRKSYPLGVLRGGVEMTVDVSGEKLVLNQFSDIGGNLVPIHVER